MTRLATDPGPPADAFSLSVIARAVQGPKFVPSAEETALRLDLAACYRLVAHYGWDDLVVTHISARVTGEHDAFLINPFGLMFEEVTPENLVKINMRGEIISDTPYGVNGAGFVIHSAIHEARPDAHCVIHLHTRDGIAVSCVEGGLLPMNQGAIGVAEDLAYHDFEGPALDPDERVRLQQDLGDKNMMLLRNHGTLAVGRTVGSAFYRIRSLEQACTTQVRTLSQGLPTYQPSAESVEQTRAQISADYLERFANEIAWPALRRKAARLGASTC
jgi:ribulose-5-phosphate 4-epimerase/fuculose-1-phosphate aldolase